MFDTDQSRHSTAPVTASPATEVRAILAELAAIPSESTRQIKITIEGELLEAAIPLGYFNSPRFRRIGEILKGLNEFSIETTSDSSGLFSVFGLRALLGPFAEDRVACVTWVRNESDKLEIAAYTVWSATLRHEPGGAFKIQEHEDFRTKSISSEFSARELGELLARVDHNSTRSRGVTFTNFDPPVTISHINHSHLLVGRLFTQELGKLPEVKIRATFAANGELGAFDFPFCSHLLIGGIGEVTFLRVTQEPQSLDDAGNKPLAPLANATHRAVECSYFLPNLKNDDGTLLEIARLDVASEAITTKCTFREVVTKLHPVMRDLNAKGTPRSKVHDGLIVLDGVEHPFCGLNKGGGSLLQTLVHQTIALEPEIVLRDKAGSTGNARVLGVVWQGSPGRANREFYCHLARDANNALMIAEVHVLSPTRKIENRPLVEERIYSDGRPSTSELTVAGFAEASLENAGPSKPRSKLVLPGSTHEFVDFEPRHRFKQLFDAEVARLPTAILETPLSNCGIGAVAGIKYATPVKGLTDHKVIVHVTFGQPNRVQVLDSFGAIVYDATRGPNSARDRALQELSVIDRLVRGASSHPPGYVLAAKELMMNPPPITCDEAAYSRSRIVLEYRGPTAADRTPAEQLVAVMHRSTVTGDWAPVAGAYNKLLPFLGTYLAARVELAYLRQLATEGRLEWPDELVAVGAGSGVLYDAVEEFHPRLIQENRRKPHVIDVEPEPRMRTLSKNPAKFQGNSTALPFENSSRGGLECSALPSMGNSVAIAKSLQEFGRVLKPGAPCVLRSDNIMLGEGFERAFALAGLSRVTPFNGRISLPNGYTNRYRPELRERMKGVLYHSYLTVLVRNDSVVQDIPPGLCTFRRRLDLPEFVSTASRLVRQAFARTSIGTNQMEAGRGLLHILDELTEAEWRSGGVLLVSMFQKYCSLLFLNDEIRQDARKPLRGDAIEELLRQTEFTRSHLQAGRRSLPSDANGDLVTDLVDIQLRISERILQAFRGTANWELGA